MSISLWENLALKSEALAKNAFKNIDSLDDWNKVRTQMLGEFKECLGLSPFPKKCDLKIKEYGVVSEKDYTMKKIAFQILPDCWNSAAIFYPQKM